MKGQAKVHVAEPLSAEEIRMTYQALTDELTYRSYRFNRLNAPEVEPIRWAAIFSGWRLLEERFCAEMALESAGAA